MKQTRALTTEVCSELYYKPSSYCCDSCRGNGGSVVKVNYEESSVGSIMNIQTWDILDQLDKMLLE